jgi:hypothetical protein
VVVPLAIATVSLLLAIFRAYQAVGKSIQASNPNIRRKVMKRDEQPEDVAKRQRYAALLLAADRAQLVADWKAARVRQAARAYGVAVAAGVLVTLIYAADVLLA